MTVFLIILMLVILALLLSMIYSMGQTNKEYHKKFLDIAQKYAAMDMAQEKTVRRVTDLENEVHEEKLRRMVEAQKNDNS